MAKTELQDGGSEEGRYPRPKLCDQRLPLKAVNFTADSGHFTKMSGQNYTGQDILSDHFPNLIISTDSATK